MKSFILKLFYKVASVLEKGASILRISYNEINIIAYYLVISLTWAIMLDVYLGTPITSIAFLFIWTGIRIGAWGRFSEWCDWIFKKSVDFLNFFNKWGGNYKLNSVIICVLVPILIYIGLIYLLIR